MKKALSPIFRPLSENDLIEVYHLDQLCYEPEIAYSFQTIIFFYYYLNTISYVAEIEKEIAGFILADIKRKDKAHIITLDIHPDFRRQGLATHLLELAEKEAINKGIKSISLEVDIDNEAAINLYEKCGYAKVKKLKNYYRKRKDAFLMRKEFQKAKKD